jgi:hypothetical protein
MAAPVGAPASGLAGFGLLFWLAVDRGDQVLMREFDDDDPRLIASANKLLESLQPYVGQHFDIGNIERIYDVVKDHRAAFRREHGSDFPPLVPFILPSLKYIHFVRADIEDREISIQLRNIIVQLSRRKVLPHSLEIASAAKRCWPLYKPPIEHFRADPLLRQKLQ